MADNIVIEMSNSNISCVSNSETNFNKNRHYVTLLSLDSGTSIKTVDKEYALSELFKCHTFLECSSTFLALLSFASIPGIVSSIIAIIYEISSSGLSSQELWDNVITFISFVISAIGLYTFIFKIDCLDPYSQIPDYSEHLDDQFKFQRIKTMVILQQPFYNVWCNN